MQISKEFSDTVASLFKGKNFAFVASLMSDGGPQITPVWVDYDGKFILINTAEGRTKQRNFVRDPRVAVSVVDHENPYNMVTIRGRIVEQTASGADEHIDKLAKKYLGVDKYPFRSASEKRVILKIKPEKVFHMSN
ncbi:PPOX class F420-dependent oxidoreductase [Candidatus Nitrosotenuis uzonensis]|uniref:Flavin nucleotide binding protein n=1 Tax=Candidatus Nitrosotenuis uzonensis TaxID=1407055 RepID=A0A812EU66_9ARCH|nr:PPOX class F420-dependent oxidoreductase [Candidatus Nitrosotenuis uzonensis]CAE6487899.1 Flavin nucleotide binding protein [Candidatus Nitrosotenuis uzonensis]